MTFLDDSEFGIVKEYILFLKDELIDKFFDENELRSISMKTNCHVELTPRILNKKVGAFRIIKYAIIQIRGKDNLSIRQCNKLLEQRFPYYRTRQEYVKKTYCCTLFGEEALPDNASLYFSFQRSGPTTYNYGNILLKSPFESSLTRPLESCYWKYNDSDLRKGIIVPSTKQAQNYFTNHLKDYIQPQDEFKIKNIPSTLFAQNDDSPNVNEAKPGKFNDYPTSKEKFVFNKITDNSMLQKENLKKYSHENKSDLKKYPGDLQTNSMPNDDHTNKTVSKDLQAGGKQTKANDNLNDKNYTNKTVSKDLQAEGKQNKDSDDLKDKNQKNKIGSKNFQANSKPSKQNEDVKDRGRKKGIGPKDHQEENSKLDDFSTKSQKNKISSKDEQGDSARLGYGDESEDDIKNDHRNGQRIRPINEEIFYTKPEKGIKILYVESKTIIGMEKNSVESSSGEISVLKRDDTMNEITVMEDDYDILSLKAKDLKSPFDTANSILPVYQYSNEKILTMDDEKLQKIKDDKTDENRPQNAKSVFNNKESKDLFKRKTSALRIRHGSEIRNGIEEDNTGNLENKKQTKPKISTIISTTTKLKDIKSRPSKISENIKSVEGTQKSDIQMTKHSKGSTIYEDDRLTSDFESTGFEPIVTKSQTIIPISKKENLIMRSESVILMKSPVTIANSKLKDKPDKKQLLEGFDKIGEHHSMRKSTKEKISNKQNKNDSKSENSGAIGKTSLVSGNVPGTADDDNETRNRAEVTVDTHNLKSNINDQRNEKNDLDNGYITPEVKSSVLSKKPIEELIDDKNKSKNVNEDKDKTNGPEKHSDTNRQTSTLEEPFDNDDKLTDISIDKRYSKNLSFSRKFIDRSRKSECSQCFKKKNSRNSIKYRPSILIEKSVNENIKRTSTRKNPDYSNYRQSVDHSSQSKPNEKEKVKSENNKNNQEMKKSTTSEKRQSLDVKAKQNANVNRDISDENLSLQHAHDVGDNGQNVDSTNINKWRKVNENHQTLKTLTRLNNLSGMDLLVQHIAEKLMIDVSILNDSKMNYPEVRSIDSESKSSETLFSINFEIPINSKRIEKNVANNNFIIDKPYSFIDNSDNSSDISTLSKCLVTNFTEIQYCNNEKFIEFKSQQSIVNSNISNVRALCSDYCSSKSFDLESLVPLFDTELSMKGYQLNFGSITEINDLLVSLDPKLDCYSLTSDLCCLTYEEEDEANMLSDPFVYQTETLGRSGEICRTISKTPVEKNEKLKFIRNVSSANNDPSVSSEVNRFYLAHFKIDMESFQNFSFDTDSNYVLRVTEIILRKTHSVRQKDKIIDDKVSSINVPIRMSFKNRRETNLTIPKVSKSLHSGNNHNNSSNRLCTNEHQWVPVDIQSVESDDSNKSRSSSFDVEDVRPKLSFYSEKSRLDKYHRVDSFDKIADWISRNSGFANA